MTTETLDLPEHRKARGAFFTPAALCRYAVRWAVRNGHDSVMEPSCGEAAFMLAAGDRLRELGNHTPELTGYELHEQSADRASKLLADEGLHARIEVGDFLEQQPDARYAAVVGNPPYVRFQGFTGESRAAGLRVSQAQGVAMSGLASSWAPFVVHSSSFLRDDGRLVLVLPAELLSSNYAASVRAFLMRRFARLRVVLFDGLVFPGVQTEALLLMAEGTGGTDEVEFSRAQTLDHLDELEVETVLRPHRHDEKWTHALLSAQATDALRSLHRAGFVELSTLGRLSLGAVSGANSFFALSRDEAERWGLRRNDLVRISPPGSSHLRALTLGRNQYAMLAQAGAPVYLFKPESKPSSAAKRYIAEGEKRGVHEAYKCRVRSPWWRVPTPEAPDLFFTYMNAHTPQMCTNPLGLRYLNSVHGVYLADEYRSLRELLPLAALNSATMLSAETTGRAYGGGILKMEPREAARLAVPGPQLIASLEDDLGRLTSRVRRLLRDGQLDTAAELVDDVLLCGAAGVSADQLAEMRSGRGLLAQRRRERGQKERGKNAEAAGAGTAHGNRLRAVP